MSNQQAWGAQRSVPAAHPAYAPAPAPTPSQDQPTVRLQTAPLVQQSPYAAPQAQSGTASPAKKKRKWGPGKVTLAVVFSPFIAAVAVVYAMFWTLAWLLTPLGLAVHMALWPFGCAWIALVRLLGAKPQNRRRMFKPFFPQFPQFWKFDYWRRMRSRTGLLLEVVGELASEFN